MSMPIIEHAVVCGDGKNYLTALVTLKVDYLAEFATRRPPRRQHDFA
jgi:long-subunit acyl-CoA synthetase (AMP-forming)